MQNAINFNYFNRKQMLNVEHGKLLGCFHLTAYLDKYLFLVLCHAMFFRMNAKVMKKIEKGTDYMMFKLKIKGSQPPVWAFLSAELKNHCKTVETFKKHCHINSNAFSNLKGDHRFKHLSLELLSANFACIQIVRR